ncbi:MAG: hypothetical protein LBM95_02710 [Lactobacillales bacterium]|nr:hypothetical protein [Lactobacillales bacterium]
MSDFSTILITQNDMTDNELKAFIDELKENSVKELFVLPSYLSRAKTLLEGSGIMLGSFVDYPLAAGTIAKIAFETGELFRMGADILQVSLSIVDVKRRDWAHLEKVKNTVTPLAYGSSELRFSIETANLKEIDKIHLARVVNHLEIPSIAIDTVDTESAMHDATIFRMDGGNDLFIQVNIQNGTNDDIELIFENGASQVGRIVKAVEN